MVKKTKFNKTNTSYFFIIGVLIILTLYMIYLLHKNYSFKSNKKLDINTNINLVENEKKYNEERLLERTEGPGFVYDNRVYDDRLVYPEKKVPINIKTRGYPSDYQQIGILTNENDKNDIKPLYGRQTYTGSNMWNYYTSTDSDLALKIPINYKNDKCTSERGCEEIYNNNVIDINNSKYKFDKYETDEFRYIPYI